MILMQNFFGSFLENRIRSGQQPLYETIVFEAKKQAFPEQRLQEELWVWRQQ